jgi:hypothetical protein
MSDKEAAKYSITRIVALKNEALQKQFEARIEVLKQRIKTETFRATWRITNREHERVMNAVLKRLDQFSGLLNRITV